MEQIKVLVVGLIGCCGGQKYDVGGDLDLMLLSLLFASRAALKHSI